MSVIRQVCILCLSLSLLAAQTSLGTITGTVTDPAGAPVPSVEVIARAVNTGLTFKGQTNDSDVYVMFAMPPGWGDVG